MGVHISGGTSSPGCSNYPLRKTALRRTATDNSPNYDTEVAETLLHNFYVDDHLLKSVESEEIAIQLIKDVRRMCGGLFNLTKFICNRKANADLDGSLPVKRALGIYWDIDKDTFKFKINLTEKPMTCRGIYIIYMKFICQTKSL